MYIYIYIYITGVGNKSWCLVIFNITQLLGIQSPTETWKWCSKSKKKNGTFTNTCCIWLCVYIYIRYRFYHWYDVCCHSHSLFKLIRLFMIVHDFKIAINWEINVFWDKASWKPRQIPWLRLLASRAPREVDPGIARGPLAQFTGKMAGWWFTPVGESCSQPGFSME